MSEGLARTADPETSQAAARSVGVNRLFVAVLQSLQSAYYYGLTINQTAVMTGLPEVSISPRFRPLREKGLIYNTGEKRVNRSGRRAIVWKITTAGRDYLPEEVNDADTN